MKIGDRVVRIPTVSKVDMLGKVLEDHDESGTVIYIHPLGRYHVVQFDDGTRESYHGDGTEIKAEEIPKPQRPPEKPHGVESVSGAFRAFYTQKGKKYVVGMYANEQDAINARTHAECRIQRERTEELRKAGKSGNITKLPNGRYSVRFSLFGGRHNAGTYDTYEEAFEALLQKREQVIEERDYKGALPGEVNKDDMHNIRISGMVYTVVFRRGGQRLIVGKYRDLEQAKKARDKWEAEHNGSLHT